MSSLTPPVPRPPGRPTPPPPPPEQDDPFSGPYDPASVDAYGHPLNTMGRCEGMNATPPTCPPA